MKVVWIVLLAIVVAGVGAYWLKARRSRAIDVLDAQRTAMKQLRGGVGRGPED